MEQTTNAIFNVNVVPNTNVPDTGFWGGVISGLGPGGCSLIIAAILAVIGSVVFYVLRRKFANSQKLKLASATCLVIGVGLAIPAITVTASAISSSSLTIDFNVVSGSTSTTTAELPLDSDYEYGYDVYAYIEGDVTLYNSADPNSKLVATEPTTSLDGLTMNSYGVQTAINNYAPISTDATNATLVYTTDDAAVSGSTAPITFVSKASDDITLGTYTGQITFKVIPKSNDLTLASLEAENATMQDSRMLEACLNSSVSERQYTFTDSRDNKSYTVAKYKDGKCWMTQNLDLQLDSSHTYTKADTNLSSVDSWQPSASTKTNLDDYEYRNGEPESVKVSSVPDEYGTYYNQAAAYASNDSWGDYSEVDEVPNSICPAGWKLPSLAVEWNWEGTEVVAIASGDYHNLMLAYGGAWSYDYDAELDYSYWAWRMSSSIISAPLNLYAAGYVDFEWLEEEERDATILAYLNEYGGFWVSNKYQYFTSDATKSGLEASDAGWNSKSYEGQSIRCIIGGETFALNYSENTDDTVTNMPETVTYGPSNDAKHTFTVSDQIPVREDNEFLGWCDNDTIGNTCRGNLYAPNSSIEVEDKEEYSVTLNAVWKYGTPTIESVDQAYLSAQDDSTKTLTFTGTNLGYLSEVKIGTESCNNVVALSETKATCQIGKNQGILDSTTDFTEAGLTANYMQAMTFDISNNTSVPTYATVYANGDATSIQIGYYQEANLVDSRDNKVYNVVKQADGNTWMTENLRLGSTTYDIELTPNDTNISTIWTLPARALDASWISGKYDEANVYASDEIDSGTGYYYGYYYNYNAVSAGTDNGTSTAALTSDICPKGWSLPSNYASNPDKSYSKLLYSYGIIEEVASTDIIEYTEETYAKMQSAPLKLFLSGGHNDGGNTLLPKWWGLYWTKNSAESHNAYGLFLMTSNVRLQDYNNNGKSRGDTVRCVAN